MVRVVQSRKIIFESLKVAGFEVVDDGIEDIKYNNPLIQFFKDYILLFATHTFLEF